MEACRDHCRRALQLAEAIHSRESLAAVEMVRYLERICAGDFDVALQCYERALPVLREKGLSAANLLGMNIRGALHLWRGENREADEVLDWCLEKAREIGDLPRIVQNRFMRAMSLGRQGRLGKALEMTLEARRLAEMTGERVQLARFPNTLGWLHRELQDLEGALELDLEGVRFTREIGDTESEINSRINAGQVFLLLGDADSAFEHLERARLLLAPFQWFHWLFETRLEAEWASYWIARGDTRQAESHARAALEITRRSLVRKYVAWSRRLLGDIAAMEERAADARREYDAALGVLAQYPAPGVEWVVRQSLAAWARKTGDMALAGEEAAHAGAIIRELANSVPDGNLREKLLGSRAARELKA
jgi:tetratricopeptide (TPR) repeat protein